MHLAGAPGPREDSATLPAKQPCEHRGRGKQHKARFRILDRRSFLGVADQARLGRVSRRLFGLLLGGLIGGAGRFLSLLDRLLGRFRRFFRGHGQRRCAARVLGGSPAVRILVTLERRAIVVGGNVGRRRVGPFVGVGVRTVSRYVGFTALRILIGIAGRIFLHGLLRLRGARRRRSRVHTLTVEPVVLFTLHRPWRAGRGRRGSRSRRRSGGRSRRRRRRRSGLRSGLGRRRDRRRLLRSDSTVEVDALDEHTSLVVVADLVRGQLHRLAPGNRLGLRSANRVQLHTNLRTTVSNVVNATGGGIVEVAAVLHVARLDVNGQALRLLLSELVHLGRANGILGHVPDVEGDDAAGVDSRSRLALCVGEHVVPAQVQVRPSVGGRDVGGTLFLGSILNTGHQLVP